MSHEHDDGSPCIFCLITDAVEDWREKSLAHPDPEISRLADEASYIAYSLTYVLGDYISQAPPEYRRALSFAVGEELDRIIFGRAVEAPTGAADAAEVIKRQDTDVSLPAAPRLPRSTHGGSGSVN